MATTDFSVGIDCQLVLIMGALGRLDISHVTEFQSEAVTHEVIVHRLNGAPLGRFIPGGWRFRFSIERGTSAVEDMIALAESGYWNGQRLPAGQLYQYISEVSGSVSTYLFDGVVIRLPEAGQWKQENSTRQSLEGFAGQRRRV